MQDGCFLMLEEFERYARSGNPLALATHLRGRTGRQNNRNAIRRHPKDEVWPVDVELALICGLEKYRPSKKLKKNFTRFPKRNRYLSDYIFNHTNVRRTAKQVGSRLQQMRDTCTDPRLQYLLLRREFSEVPAEAGSSIQALEDTSPSPTLSTASSPAASPSASLPSSSASSPGPASFGPLPAFIEYGLSHNGRSSFSELHISHQEIISEYPQRDCITLAFSQELPEYSPVVTLHFPVALMNGEYYCRFTVFQGDAALYSENAALVPTPAPYSESFYSYDVPLSSSYWSALHNLHPSSLYEITLLQEVIHIPAPSSRPNGWNYPEATSIAQTTYYFDYLRPRSASYVSSFTAPAHNGQFYSPHPNNAGSANAVVPDEHIVSAFQGMGIQSGIYDSAPALIPDLCREIDHSLTQMTGNSHRNPLIDWSYPSPSSNISCSHQVIPPTLGSAATDAMGNGNFV